MVHFMWNLLIFNFKDAFHKTKNIATLWLQHFMSETTCWLTLKFLGVVHYKMGPKNFWFLISCYGNCKNAVFFDTITTGTHSGNPYSST